ncbi:MAG: hypothetical protein LBP59_10685 [Planctomycetaceae bacterium]|jgi:hypothetical protein|nr:hypothetical protein [Planctomycetaceae bacterium]
MEISLSGYLLAIVELFEFSVFAADVNTRQFTNLMLAFDRNRNVSENAIVTDKIEQLRQQLGKTQFVNQTDVIYNLIRQSFELLQKRFNLSPFDTIVEVSDGDIEVLLEKYNCESMQVVCQSTQIVYRRVLNVKNEMVREYFWSGFSTFVADVYGGITLGTVRDVANNPSFDNVLVNYFLLSELVAIEN